MATPGELLLTIQRKNKSTNHSQSHSYIHSHSHLFTHTLTHALTHAFTLICWPAFASWPHKMHF